MLSNVVRDVSKILVVGRAVSGNGGGGPSDARPLRDAVDIVSVVGRSVVVVEGEDDVAAAAVPVGRQAGPPRAGSDAHERGRQRGRGRRGQALLERSVGVPK